MGNGGQREALGDKDKSRRKDRTEQERLPGAGRAADYEVLPSVHPLQRAQRLLGRDWDRAGLALPGVEGLPGRERCRASPGGQRGELACCMIVRGRRFRC